MFFIKFIKYLFSFFQGIYIFEAQKNNKIIKYKNFNLKFFKSKKHINNLLILEYLKENNKINRFKKNYYLLVLFYKKNFVCCGWMHETDNWHISEINTDIKTNNLIVLFDFFTVLKFRNKGFYKKILILIRNKRTKKSFLIYCLKTNIRSKKGILNAGFNLKKEIKKI